MATATAVRSPAPRAPAPVVTPVARASTSSKTLASPGPAHTLKPTAPARGRIVQVAGKSMYMTGDGKVVELLLAGGTRLYVYYDVDNKTYSGSPIHNDPGGAHAEAKFASGHIGSLRGQIAQHEQKGTLKTPVGQPVKVELNLNRITCPRCSSIVAGLASGSKDMMFVVKASSVSNEATFEVHAQWIADLIDKGVVVEPLGIWPEIKKKFIEVTKKMGKGEIAFKGQSDNYLSFVAVARRIDENLGKEQGVKDLIDRAKQLLEDKKKASKDNLNKVPPKGSGA